MRFIILFLLFVATARLSAQTVDELLAQLEDPQANHYKIYRTLQRTDLQEFKKNHRTKLITLLRNPAAQKHELIRIIGYVGIESAKPELWSIADSVQLASKVRWSAYLALIRLSDKQAEDFVYKKISSVAVNDDFVYQVVPDIVYTKSRRLLNFMVQEMSKDKENCHSPDPDNPVKINCAYRIMEALAPVIEDFPYQQTAGGDLDVDNYPVALEDIRRWFEFQAGNYKIRKNTF